jgi:hypothetical protein
VAVEPPVSTWNIVATVFALAVFLAAGIDDWRSGH